MPPCRLRCRFKCIRTAGQAGTRQTCQYIACARSGKPGVAGGVDQWPVSRLGNHAARSLEYDDTTGLISQLLRRAQTVGLDR